MAAVRTGIVLLALTTFALGDEEAVLLQDYPRAARSLAEHSEGLAAMKAGIVEKTEHLAKALEGAVEALRLERQRACACAGPRARQLLLLLPSSCPRTSPL